VDAWNRRDPDALAALFDDDAEFVNVTGLWWHTRDEIGSAHAYGFTHIFKDSALHATDVRVKRLSDAIAVVHARMTLIGQTSIGEITALRPFGCDVIRRSSDAGRLALRLSPQH
jgi:uncharacterized protein (TIGR02246 family)